MKDIPRKLQDFFVAVRVGIFLAVADIRRSNRWTTLLIIFIMTLTFLNLIVVRGILVGLVEGSNSAYRKAYIGDVLLEPLRLKKYIERTPEIESVIAGMPFTKAYTIRYLAPVTIEYGYKNKVRQSDEIESVNAVAAGVQPVMENETTNISQYIVAGEFIHPGETDAVVIGASLLSKYSPAETASQKTLKGADVGSKIRISIGGNTREVTVKGVTKTKVEAIDLRVFMADSAVRSMIGRTDFGANEISIRLNDPLQDTRAKAYLVANGADATAKVSTFEEGVPKFVKDIKVTFDILSNIIGSIGLAVAAITIFIVIFVNAITRRKYIGILKGIGVSGVAIEISYIIQALVFAVAGIGIACVLIFGVFKPYISANPINFPFGDGILVADVPDVAVRAVALFFATIVAGYIPARIVVKQRTLDAILGR